MVLDSRHCVRCVSSRTDVAREFCITLLALGGVIAYCPRPASAASLTASSATSRLARSLRSTVHRRAGVNRKRLNITAHYPKPLRLPQQSCSGLVPLRALRVRVMVCYVLRPSPDNCAIWRCTCVYPALRTSSLGSTSRPAAPGSQLVGAVPPAPTFAIAIINYL
jgi:hypothetical protein